MIKRVTIILLLGLFFFFGLTIGSELSPSQECKDLLSFYMDKFHEQNTKIATYEALNLALTMEFYNYEDGLWELKSGLKEWKFWYEKMEDNGFEKEDVKI